MKYIFFLFLFSCAQHQVGSDAAGVLISKFSSLSKKDALRTALAQAKLQCDEERMIVESKKVVYEGKLSEEENEKIKEKTNKSMIMGEGGMGQTEYATKGGNMYHAEVRFRCKP